MSFDVSAIRQLPYAEIFDYNAEVSSRTSGASCPALKTALIFMGPKDSAVMQFCSISRETFRQEFKDFTLSEKNGVPTAQKDDLIISMPEAGYLLFSDAGKTDLLLASMETASPVEPYLAALPDGCAVYAVIDVPDEVKAAKDWQYVSKIAFSLKREASGGLPNRMTILLFPNTLPDAALKVYANLTALVNQAYADAEKKGNVSPMMRLWYRVALRKDHSALLVTLDDVEAKSFLSMICENMAIK